AIAGIEREGLEEIDPSIGIGGEDRPDDPQGVAVFHEKKVRSDADEVDTFPRFGHHGEPDAVAGIARAVLAAADVEARPEARGLAGHRAGYEDVRHGERRRRDGLERSEVAG